MYCFQDLYSFLSMLPPKHALHVNLPIFGSQEFDMGEKGNILFHMQLESGEERSPKREGSASDNIDITVID